MNLSKEKKRALASLIITLGIIILFFILYQIPPLRAVYETLELKMLDLRFVLEPQPPCSGKIVHIDIDDETLRKLGFPCPRKYYADLIDILTECGSEAIVFDIHFLEPSHPTVDRNMISLNLRDEIKERLDEVGKDTDKIAKEASRGASPKDISTYLSQLKEGVEGRSSYLLKKLDETILDHDELMAEAIKRGHNVFIPFIFPQEETQKKISPQEEALFKKRFSLPIKYENLKKKENLYKSGLLSLSIETFFKNITGTGFVSAGSLDRDGVMRRIPLIWEYKGSLFPQLAFSSFLTLTKTPDQAIEIVSDKYIKITGMAAVAGKDEIVLPVDEKMHMIIHWAGKWEKAFKHIPFVGIIELKQIRNLLEKNLLLLDSKYTSERLKRVNKESSLEEIEQAKRDIFEFLERNIQRSNATELKEEYRVIDFQRKKEKELKDKITRLVKGKACFVGLTATGAHDRRPIPIQPDYPMVGLHSNLLNTILTQRFIMLASPLVNCSIFLLASLVIAIITPMLSPRKGMSTSFVLLGIFIVLGQYLFQKHGVAINMAAPMGLIISSYITITSYRYISEEKEKKWVRKAFSHYLSPKVMDEILADPGKLGLGGKRQELTVLFSDIRSFTTYCEKRAPEEVIHILNEYLDVMTNVILKYNGTLDKYVGDEIVAFFGAPAIKKPINHAEMAVKTSLEMFEELKKLQEKWKREGKEPLDFGVGINTGQMMVGNMGSTNRLDYTVIGDEVNLGARVEALTRDYNVRIILTQSTYEKVKNLAEVKKLGETTVKGKTQPVVIYELLSLKG